MKVFLAGATGVIGRSLVPLLVRAGHDVTGTTRSAGKAAALAQAGATPVVLDVFDGDAVMAAMRAAQPDTIVHQLTDLPQDANAPGMAEALARNARLRFDGTRNLLAAAKACGVRRVIVQSIAFAYAPGAAPRGESDPLDTGATGPRAVSVDGVVQLETQVLNAPGVDGIVLRYGRLYGPGTWSAERAAPPALHVDAAAHAALLALTRGTAGIYNIAEDDGAVTTEKARRELGFDAAFRLTP
jgi:nucleoside-diphosphate-sugar epimerase